MIDTLMFPEIGYSLAGEATLALSRADALARPTVIELYRPVPKIVIRRCGTEQLIYSSGPPMTPPFMKGLEKVLNVLALPPGWNSYSAKTISLDTAGEAIRLLAEVVGPKTPVPEVVPTVRGGIQLEWHRGGIDIEIYVESPTKVSFFAEEIGADQSFEGPLSGNERNLRSWIERLSGKVNARA